MRVFLNELEKAGRYVLIVAAIYGLLGAALTYPQYIAPGFVAVALTFMAGAALWALIAPLIRYVRRRWRG